MDLAFEFDGEIVERQELLNGTQSVTVEGRSADGRWAVSLDISWNLGILDFDGEGDITIAGQNGTEAFGSLASAVATVGERADWSIVAAFDIDGGTDRWEAVRGRAEVTLEITVTKATGRVAVNLKET